SQVAMVMASQCLLLNRPKKMRITVNGQTGPGVFPKDVILYIISKLGTGGGTGHFVEYAGDVFRNMSMEGRMTVCNMSIEMGARGGLIAPDQTTFDYIKGRKFAPSGEAFDQAVAYWKTLPSDEDAVFDTEYHFDAADIEPMITYGTNPGMGIKITGRIPQLDEVSSKENFRKSLEYMGLQPGMSLLGKKIDHVFIGSCTNSRIEDLRLVARIVKGRRKAANVQAMIVPGSRQVADQAREEGIDQVLREAGFQMREAGCSACLGMNEDKIPPGEYCVSTSNRNFEGRQGPGARTFLVSPLLAAVIAREGRMGDARTYADLADVL